ncbi:hypothetical protein IVB30_40025 [Bradyrhizobium sp. 200]|uniref:hypothetical protein n=1 Tax=Bradyrhizobium sp. 200 TaxID=2782665 RepID=UPI001FFFD4C4|nr:hypothetical protein [Bradyrhizobium sp. 200]UPJ54671.1 hypothetical protein IVB30_40025 [Bradyrhizobium sp. 200]
MSNPLYAFPAVCEQTLRALARYPERTAVSWREGVGKVDKKVLKAGFWTGRERMVG